MTGVILAVVDDPRAAAHTLPAARSLAEVTGAVRINVLAIRTPPLATIMVTEEMLTCEDEGRIRAEERARAAVIRQVFDAWAPATWERGIATEWCDVEARADAAVAEWGRRADFVMLKRPWRRNPERERQADEKQAIRAVIPALRCLTAAERVHVLAGVREGAERLLMPSVLLEHGIHANLHVLPIGSRSFGQALLDKTHEVEADLLVMGAYSHSPLRELILGGVTRYMLSHADVPVLMRH